MAEAAKWHDRCLASGCQRALHRGVHCADEQEECVILAEEQREEDAALQQKEIDIADPAYIADLRGFNDGPPDDPWAGDADYPPDDFNPYEGRNDPEDW